MNGERERLTERKAEAAIAGVVFSSPYEILAMPAFCSVAALRQQAEADWNEVRKLGEGSAMLPADFAVPRVSTMPVITVRWAQSALRSQIRMEDLDETGDHGFGFLRNPPMACCEQIPYRKMPLSFAQGWNHRHFGRGTLTPEEAVRLVQGKVETYSCGQVRIMLDSLTAVFQQRQPGCSWAFRGPEGYYELYFRQMLRGVPILGSIADTLHYSVKEKGSGYPVPTAYIASGESYWIGTSYMVETGVVHEDIPLLPFAAMSGIWEEMRHCGQISNAESIRLGYVLYAGHPDPAEIIGLPSWVMRCQYHDSSDDIPRKRDLIFHAQTGEMAEVNCRRADGARKPDIITWQEVQGKAKARPTDLAMEPG